MEWADLMDPKGHVAQADTARTFWFVAEQTFEHLQREREA